MIWLKHRILYHSLILFYKVNRINPDAWIYTLAWALITYDENEIYQAWCASYYAGDNFTRDPKRDMVFYATRYALAGELKKTIKIMLLWMVK